jgi:hypothetical protein
MEPTDALAVLRARRAELEAELQHIDYAERLLTSSKVNTGPAALPTAPAIGSLAHTSAVPRPVGAVGAGGTMDVAVRVINEGKRTRQVDDSFLADMTSLGWSSPASDPTNTVRSALHRAASEQYRLIKRVGRGLYAPLDAEGTAAGAAVPSVPVPATQEGGSAHGTDAPRVRDHDSSGEASDLDHGFGASVVEAT